MRTRLSSYSNQALERCSRVSSVEIEIATGAGGGQARKLRTGYAVNRVTARRTLGADDGGRVLRHLQDDLALGHHAHAIEEILGTESYRALLLDVCVDDAAHGQHQIGGCQANTAVGGLQEHVAEDGHGALFVGYALAATEHTKEVFFADDDVHEQPGSSRIEAWRPGLCGGESGWLGSLRKLPLPLARLAPQGGAYLLEIVVDQIKVVVLVGAVETGDCLLTF
jgi:hypothetical protein